MASFEIVELNAAGKPRPFPAGVFPDGKSASSIIAELKLKYPNKKFQPRPLKDETSDWRAREQRRFDDGIYTPLNIDLPEVKDHYAHRAINIPANVAYTPEQQAGVVDKQVSVHIRAYIARHYSHLDTEIKRKIVWDYCGEKFGDEMEIARTAEEIRHVYENGPSSCMSYSADNWSNLDGHHPSEAYASPDLGIAYLKNTRGDIVARTLIAVDKKIHSVIYGDREKMIQALKANNYKSIYSDNDWFGLRMLKLAVDNGYVCPYLDSFCYVKVVGDYLEICRYSDIGSMNGSDTDGQVYTEGKNDDESDSYYD